MWTEGKSNVICLLLLEHRTLDFTDMKVIGKC